MKLFDELGYTLDARDVQRIILGWKNKKEEKRGT